MMQAPARICLDCLGIFCVTREMAWNNVDQVLLEHFQTHFALFGVPDNSYRHKLLSTQLLVCKALISNPLKGFLLD